MNKVKILSENLNTAEYAVWTRILRNWAKIHQVYYDQCWQDKAYSYNERASISMLAAAIWKSKGIAIEEYVAEKNHDGEIKKGRVDLWFKIGDFSGLVEAKQMKKSVKSLTLKSADYSKQLSTINKFIEYAQGDVRKSIGNEPNGYSIVFLHLDNQNHIEINLSSILSQIEKSDCDFYACVSCGDSRESSPAGILLGKKFHKAKSGRSASKKKS